MIRADGGTSTSHHEDVARSTNPMGPYEAYSQNPILSHAEQNVGDKFNDLDIKSTGHGDFVSFTNQDGEEEWWMVFLGTRSMDDGDSGIIRKEFHHLGRESFMAPVNWTNDEWPEVNNGELIETEMPIVPNLPEHKWRVSSVYNVFTDQKC